MKFSRKEFIQHTGYTSLAALFTLLGCDNKKEYVTQPLNEKKILTDATLKKLSKSDWSEIRKLFTFSTHPPLNAANLCPVFDHVTMFQWKLTNRISSDVSFINRLDVVKEYIKPLKEKLYKNVGNQKYKLISICS
ncbi:MAG: hypothetical protein WBK20_11615 [Spirochaetota bacterium]